MKKISSMLVAMAFLFALNVSANELDTPKPANKLTTQIYKMLEKDPFELDADELTAEVRFTVNKGGELVVLWVETNNGKLESYVKKKLNYKKVGLNGASEGKVYKISLRITA